MPDLPKPHRRKYRPKKVVHANSISQEFHNKSRWRKLSRAIRQAHPLCEIAFMLGETRPSQHVDHIISIKQGGAPYDERNLMPISKYYHDIKSGHEAHGRRVQGKKGDGGLVPVDREEVYEWFR